MKTATLLASLLSGAALAYLLAAVPPAGAQSVEFAYTPPLRGTPSEATRVGGGTRGAQGENLTLNVLVPEHTGLTTRAQPTLHWFTSERVTMPVQITVVHPERIEPLLDLALDPPIEPGIQSVSLAEHGVRLEPEVEYQWFVALIADPAHRSRDFIAGGGIRRVAPPAGLRAEARAGPSLELLRSYAEAGIWYDTLDGLTRLIASQPDAGGLREQRAMLFDQVGLGEAAAFDRPS